MKLPWKKYIAETEQIEEEEFQLLTGYSKYVYGKYLFIIACLVGLFIVSGLSISVGAGNVGFFRAYEIVIEHIQGNIVDEIDDYIIWDVRLPPLIAGILAGSALAVAGAVMQSTLKNPLADPYTTGISSGASFGATLAIVMGINVFGNGYGTVFNAFIFSLIPMFAIMVVSQTRHASPTTIILAGLAVMYLFNAMTTVMMLRADPNALAEAFTWQVGTLALTVWKQIPIMAIFTFIGIITLSLLSYKINILNTGDESAKSLGIDADTLRIVCLVIVSLMSAAIVSFTGIIGFVGLVCPHMCRMIIGADNRYLIPASALFGAMFLVLADLIGNNIILPSTLQVGVVTSFIGAPVLIFLLIKLKKEAW